MCSLVFIFIFFFAREDKIQERLALYKQLWLWKPSQASIWIMKGGPSRPAAAPARDRPGILSLCEMLEREADQAFHQLLDMSLSFTPAWVTRGPITLLDPPPSVRLGPALTLVGECEQSAPVLTLAYHCLQRCPSSQINAIECIIHSKMMHLISKIFAAAPSLHFEVTSKYVEAGPPLRKILHLIKKTSRKSLGIMMV